MEIYNRAELKRQKALKITNIFNLNISTSFDINLVISIESFIRF